MAFWCNREVKNLWDSLKEGEQQKAREIFNSLDGVNIERARQVLKFCEAVIEINAQIKVLEIENGHVI